MVTDNQVSLEDALEIAKKQHQAGNLTLADRTYRDIIKVLPEDFTSLHYLGVIAFQRGNPAEGVEFMEKAIAVQDDNPDSWNAYAIMLAQIGRRQEAIKKWEKALELKPDFPDALSNMGNTLWELGRFEEAKDKCEQAIKLQPDFTGAYVNLGNALTSLEQREEAIDIWKKALEINPKQYHALINIGNALRELSKIQESEEYCRKALEQVPNSPEALLNLGNALRDQGNHKEAEQLYRQATEERPDYAEAHNNLAIVLMELLRFDEAVTSAKYAIAFDPQHVSAHSNLAAALRELGKLPEAEEAARKALNIDPQSVEARIDLADILFVYDRYDEAETLFSEAVELMPDSPRLYIKLSTVLERANKVEQALETIKIAVENNPEMPDVYHRQAILLMSANDIEGALKSIDKTIEIKPNFANAYGTKSDILQTHGDMEGAREAAEQALELNDKIPFVYFTLSKVKKFTKDDPAFKSMKELEDNAHKYGKVQAIALHYALFKAHEDIGEHDKAFEHLKKANDLKFTTVVHDTDAQDASFSHIKKVYTKDLIESFEGQGYDSDCPIFIVGMPRSGTTLTEQIISSHPDVFGAGELHFLGQAEADIGFVNPDNCKELGKAYVDYTRGINDEAKDAKKITDKMPGNFMRIGQIVTSLPNAKIIHCQRNPIDTCLSCYKQLFARGHYWTYDLDAMANHYALYHDMMQHWRDVLPEGRFLEIKYEDTVNNFENQARRLIDFVDIEWDDACLTPHKTKRSIMTASKGQVRKPIYKTSVEAWRRYEEQLTPLATALNPFIEK